MWSSDTGINFWNEAKATSLLKKKFVLCLAFVLKVVCVWFCKKLLCDLHFRCDTMIG